MTEKNTNIKTEDTQKVEEVEEKETQTVEEVETEVKDEAAAKTFTQEEVNKLIAERLKREKPKSQSENNDEDNYKEELNELKATLEEIKSENLLLVNGVKKEYITDVLALAKVRDGELKDTVKEVLELYPNFKEEAGTRIKTGNTATNTEANEADIRFANMKKRMGL